MDRNKLSKLLEIGYELRNTCGNCVYGEFRVPGADWGTCANWTYDHLKHSESQRQLSIHKSGHCSAHVADEISPQWEVLRENA